MRGKISKTTIDKAFSAGAERIVDVIGDFVKLKKKGGNHWGLSPFVNERTPSFAVSAPKGIWKDFSSGRGGSAVGFLMDAQGMDYRSAITYLCDKFGIAMEYDGEDNEPDTTGPLKAVMRRAVELLHSNASEVEDFFARRGIDATSIEHWQLGYSPRQQDWLSSRLIQDGFTPSVIVDANLAIRFDDRLIDRFKGRIIFPIHDALGNPIAIGGRVMDGTAQGVAKYINSAESAIYNKSKVLYGLHHARRSMMRSETGILVEGYTDVIVLHAHGFTNTIGSCGTALTQDQCTAMQRFGKSFLIARDSDKAGITATERDVRVMLGCGLYPSVLPFPKGEDPDSYCRKLGRDGFGNHINTNTRNFLDFLVKFHNSQSASSSATGNDGPEGVAKTVHAVREVLRLIKDPVLREISVSRLAELVKVPRHVVDIHPNPVSADPTNPSASHATSKYHSLIAHERAAIELLCNHGADLLEGSMLGELFGDAISQVPESSISEEFRCALEWLVAHDYKVAGVMDGMAGEVLSEAIALDNLNPTCDQVQAIAKDFIRHHLGLLRIACLEAIERDPSDDNMARLAALTRLQRNLG